MRFGDVGYMFQDGGVFMYVIALIFILGLLVTTICGVFTLLGRQIPAVVWYVLPAFGLVVTEVSVISGYVMSIDAIAVVAPEQKMTAAAAGMSRVLIAHWFGYLCFALSILYASFFGALACVIVRAPDKRWKLLRSLALGALWGVVLIVVLGIQLFLDVAPLWNIVLLICMFPAWLMLGARGTEFAPERDRLTFARGFTVWALAWSCLAIGLAGYGAGWSMALSGLASGTPETQMMLYAMGSHNAQGHLWIGVGTMLVTFLGALLLMGRQMRIGFKEGQLLKGTLVTILFLVYVAVFLVRVYFGSSLSEVIELSAAM